MSARRRMGGGGRGRVAAVVLAAVVCAGGVPLVGAQLFLNLVVPTLLNPHPERMQVRFAWAWMLWPGDLVVRGFELSSTGATDRWRITADEVSGTLAWRDLVHRAVNVSDVHGQGVEFVYAARPDPETEPRQRLGPRWTVALDGVALSDVRVLGLGPFRFVGDTSVRQGALRFDDLALSVSGTAVLSDLAASRLGTPVAHGLHGEVSIAVDGMDRRANLGLAFFETVTARATLDAEVESLTFLDTYLARAPWLTLRGAGPLHAELSNLGGDMQPGSFLTVESAETSVGILGWEVAGLCRIRLEVGADPDAAGSRFDVVFDDFVVRTPGSSGSLVRGSGLTLSGVTPDVGLAQPFTTLDVALDLPRSEIPSFSPFAGLLPSGLDLTIQKGRGNIRGGLLLSVPADTVRGDVFVEGRGVEATLGEVLAVSDLAVHARLAGGDLAAGLYDIAGTRIELTDVSFRSPNQPRAITDDWSATLAVRSGQILVGRPVYLTADLAMRCRDTVPFLTLFAERRALPGVARTLLTIRDIEGQGLLRLGADFVDVRDVVFLGRSFELRMHMGRERARTYGLLFARLGKLSVGVAVDGADRHIQVFNARAWFEQGGEPPPADRPPGEAASEDATGTQRAERKVERRERRVDRAAARDAKRDQPEPESPSRPGPRTGR